MAPDERPTFGNVLKYYRLAAGLTHEALAERAAVSARTISDLERGVAHAPRRETLTLLTAALGLTPAEGDLLRSAARGAVAPSTEVPHARTLPVEFTSFVGRDTESEAVRNLLQRPDTRLVTLTGAGGAGKTRLALHVARVLVPTFADGVVFVPLASVADADDVPLAVAQALGLDPDPDRTPNALVVECLRRRRLLLLLDNFEHLVDGAPFLLRLLAECSGVRLLVTSRAALRLSAEREFVVGPLPVPDLRHLPPIETLLHYAAIALFVERATQVRPDFRLTADTAADIATICVRLDGLPLALELAAARVKLLSSRALLTRLDGPDGSALHLLTDGARDLPPRQRTLRDTIAWSYDLLTPDEQRLFRRLAMFSGGCDLDAVEAICVSAPSARLRDMPALSLNTVDGVTSLLDKSLLYQDAGLDGEVRIGMLETIRGFAAEQLTATDEAAPLRGRHARYYLQIVERAGAVLVGATYQRERLAAERENIRAALRWLVETG